MAEDRICRNLRFSLEQMKIAGNKEDFLNLVENILVGPEYIKRSEMEELLGVNTDIYSEIYLKRRALMDEGLRPSWKSEGEFGGGPVAVEAGSKSPKPARRSLLQHRRPRNWQCPDLHLQFEMFSKFGDSGSDGSQITLSQSDKWLRQAGVIDGWQVTTTDTAIAFRKEWLRS